MFYLMLFYNFIHRLILHLPLVLWFAICCVFAYASSFLPPSLCRHSSSLDHHFLLLHSQHHSQPRPLHPAWQGTDLMHNHVLADVDQSCVDSPGRRSSVSRPELTSDLSEDSDYDSIWTTHSYRMGSVPRKSCISHQNWRPYSTAKLCCEVKYSPLTSLLFNVFEKKEDFFNLSIYFLLWFFKFFVNLFVLFIFRQFVWRCFRHLPVAFAISPFMCLLPFCSCHAVGVW